MKQTKILFLAFFIVGNIWLGFGQEPVSTATPETKPAPQLTPTPSKVSPEVLSELKDLDAELSKGNAILREGYEIMSVYPFDPVKTKEKFDESLSIFLSLDKKISDENFQRNITQNNQEASDLLGKTQIFTKASISINYSAIANTYRPVGGWKENVEFLKKGIDVIKEILENQSYQSNKLIPKEFFIINQESLAGNYDLLAGVLSNKLGQIEEAVTYRNKAIELYRQLFQTTRNDKYKLQEAFALYNFGVLYSDQPDNRTTAIKYLNESIAIYNLLPDQKRKIADCLAVISGIYLEENNFPSARKILQENIEIYTGLNDKGGQANSFNNLALTYWTVNDKANADKYFKKSLEILESADYIENRKKFMQSEYNLSGWDERFEFLVQHSKLTDIGFKYYFLENYPKALESFEKALAVSLSSKEVGDIASDLSYLGMTLVKMEKWEEAAKYYRQVYDIKSKHSSKIEIAEAAQDVGKALFETKEFEEALKYSNESLFVYRSIGVEENKTFLSSFSSLLITISQTYESLGNKRSAIFYGKRAVNAIQTERQKLQNLDPVSQKGFLEKKEKHYRRLAGWLIDEGRLVEAERVLAMLKEEEISGYLRRDKSLTEKLSLRIEYTPSEEKALKEYEKTSETITAIGTEFGKLNDLKRNQVKLTVEQEKRFAELNTKLTEANKNSQNFLDRLAEEFKQGKDIESEKQVNKTLQNRLARWGNDLAYIYTLIDKDRFYTILYTPNTQVEKTQNISSIALNRKIIEFREQVKNPKIDPRPLGKELYDILIRPIENQLEGAKAKTILWSLDGNLRLLPLAALWDGKQYFGQKYRNVVVPPTGYFDLDSNMSPNLSVLGLGVSQAQTVEDSLGERKITFSPLPAVPLEIASIVKTKKSPKGILPGESLLDELFTKKNLEEQLNKNYKIVHIASHFSLSAGDADKSFLLLGDGTSLTVNEFNNNPSLKFTNVELLTLSACETAVTTTDANGKEIEGFAYVAQTNGAKAILATLWSVADNSTAILMSEFYRIRKVNPNLTKAEAIQMAQNAMIEGKLNSDNAGNQKGVTLAGLPNKDNAPSFQIDKNKPFAHPYYWSPFVLIGNWR